MNNKFGVGIDDIEMTELFLAVKRSMATYKDNYGWPPHVVKPGDIVRMLVDFGGQKKGELYRVVGYGYKNAKVDFSIPPYAAFVISLENIDGSPIDEGFPGTNAYAHESHLELDPFLNAVSEAASE